MQKLPAIIFVNPSTVNGPRANARSITVAQSCGVPNPKNKMDDDRY